MAKAWVARKKARGEKVEHVRCPTGDCWHGWDLTIKDRESFLWWLVNDRSVQTDALGRKYVPQRQDILTHTTTSPEAHVLKICDAPEHEPAPVAEVPGPVECTKIRYGSKELADIILSNVEGRPGRTEARSYECANCGAWHLTSMKGEQGELHTELLVQFNPQLAVLREVWPDGSTNGLVFTYQSNTVRILKRDLPTLAAVVAHVGGESPKEPAKGRTVRGSKADSIVEYVRAHPGTSASQLAKDCACPVNGEGKGRAGAPPQPPSPTQRG